MNWKEAALNHAERQEDPKESVWSFVKYSRKRKILSLS